MGSLANRQKGGKGAPYYDYENIIHQPTYHSGQSGLDDISSSGMYTLTGNAVFQIKIDGTGSPNTFEWRKGTSDDWTSGVAMTGSAQLLQDGISITWGAITGHTVNDEWEMNVGYEVHIDSTLHVTDKITTSGDLVVEGRLRSLSSVKIQEGIEIFCDKPTDRAKISTTCDGIDWRILGNDLLALENDGTLVALAVNYEALVLADNDIPNKKYVDNNTIDKTTGWLDGGVISINSGDTTKIDITAGTIIIVDYTDQVNPTFTTIKWTAQTALDPALTTRSTWIGVRDNGSGEAEFVYDIEFDSIERRSTAILGRIWNSVGTQPIITSVGSYERPNWGLLTAFQDFVLEYGSWNIAGNVYSANGTNLLLDKSDGKSFRYHAEDIVGQENVHTDVAQSPRSSYAYHLQGSDITTNETDIDPDNYDNGGTKTVLGNNKWSVQEVWFFPVSGTCHVLYGQAIYNSKTEALDAIVSESKVRNIDILSGAILRAYLILEKGCTDLTNSSTAEIREAGDGVGGGGASAIWTKIDTILSPTVAGDDVVLNTGETLSITDMTQGSIPFVGSGGLITQDNSNLFWNNTNNRFGIRSQNPKSPLHVKGNTPGTVGNYPAGQLIIQSPGININGNAAITGYTSDIAGDPVYQLWYFGSSSSGNQDVIILNRTNANLHFGTNGSSKMIIAADGNVGIGTTTPSAELEVNGYTKLGSDAPSIKTKKLTGTSAVEGSSVAISHGLDKSKIIGAQVLVSNDDGNRIPPNFTSLGDHEFDFFIDTTNVHVYSISGNSAKIDGNAVTVLITYEE